MADYNRNEMLGSMRTSMAKESAASEPSEGKSVESTTTAGAASAATEKTPVGSPAEKGGAEGTDKKKGSDASGSEETESEDGTAQDEDGNSEGEQASEGDEDGESKEEGNEPKPKEKADESAGKLDEEETKALETWGLKDFKPTEENRKLLKIARDNQAKVQEYQQQTAVSNDYLAAVGNALVNHDIENLNTMVEELGGDKIPFDLRTEEDQIKDETESFNAVFDALEKGLSPEVFAQVQKALAPVYTEKTKKITALEKKLLVRQAGEEAAKKSGQGPVKGKYLDGLKSKADKNFIELYKGDSKAKDNMAILDPIFKMGTVLQNPAKAYAMAPKVINELGQALDFMRNFQTKYLPDLQKQWAAAEKLKRIGKPPPSGNNGDSRRGSDTSPSSPTKKYNSQVGTRLLERHGVRRG